MQDPSGNGIVTWERCRAELRKQQNREWDVQLWTELQEQQRPDKMLKGMRQVVNHRISRFLASLHPREKEGSKGVTMALQDVRSCSASRESMYISWWIQISQARWSRSNWMPMKVLRGPRSLMPNHLLISDLIKKRKLSELEPARPLSMCMVSRQWTRDDPQVLLKMKSVWSNSEQVNPNDSSTLQRSRYQTLLACFRP